MTVAAWWPSEGRGSDWTLCRERVKEEGGAGHKQMKAKCLITTRTTDTPGLTYPR